MTTPKQAADRADEIARDVVSDFCKQVGVSREYLSQGDWLEQRIAAAIRSAEPQWRYDMENAPRDGTRILICFVHQNAKYARDPVGEGWIAVHEAQWIDHNGGGWTWHGLAGVATAWRPLPAPPEAISPPDQPGGPG